MRRFYFAGEIRIGNPIDLDVDESRHLRDVLRLGVGDAVTVFDGRGHEYAATVSVIGKRTASVDVVREIDASAPESPLELTVAAAITQNDKFDLVIQKSVELGVTRIQPLKTIRSEVSLKDAARRLDRWRRIAMEATKQCGRARVMEVAQPLAFPDLLSIVGGGVLMFSERDGAKLGSGIAGVSTAIFGPKGGWDDDELAAAHDAGWHIVTFGGRIMRAETAAIGITAILQHRFGDLN